MIIYYTLKDSHHIEAVKIRNDRAGEFFEFIMRKEGEVYVLDIRDDEIEIIDFDQFRGSDFSHRFNTVDDLLDISNKYTWIPITKNKKIKGEKDENKKT